MSGFMSSGGAYAIVECLRSLERQKWRKKVKSEEQPLLPRNNQPETDDIRTQLIQTLQFSNEVSCVIL